MQGIVFSGSNTGFTVLLDDQRLVEATIKGRKLKELTGYYNALVPGDRVLVDEVDPHNLTARIVATETRRNAYSRWNQKGQAPQVFAANLDLVVCVTTPDQPPFRPRFLDRALVQAEIAGIPALIVLNKLDLDKDDADLAERLEDYKRIGYKQIMTCALDGRGLSKLQNYLAGKTSVFVGQSGVGKSTLINALVPGSELRTAALSRKYRRGVHTTTQSRLLVVREPTGLTMLIDTPGIRRLVLEGTSSAALANYFPEFAPIVGTCSFGLSCSHVQEPGCRILEAVNAGVIHEDRYTSYIGLRNELLQRKPDWKSS